jgi:uncharacterized membrane protein YGL010W
MLIDFTILIGLAFIFYILIERPFSNLMTILLSGQVFGLKDVIADHSMNNKVVLQRHMSLKT